MPKTMTVVDKAKLKEAIIKTEQDGPLENLNDLWNRAALAYNMMGPPRPITHSVVMLRAKEWGIITKTKPGKRGRQALSPEQKKAMQEGRTSRAEKFSGNQSIQEGFTQLKKEVPARFDSLVEKLTEQGSMRSAVHLKCLDCTGYQTAEIRECVCSSCPLFAFRPYQQN